MGGLLGGQRVCWPLSQIIGGLAPWPPSSYANVKVKTYLFDLTSRLQTTSFVLNNLTFCLLFALGPEFIVFGLQEYEHLT